MSNINKTQHDELISILDELIKTLEQMKEKIKDYTLFQNEREAREWIDFLKNMKTRMR